MAKTVGLAAKLDTAAAMALRDELAKAQGADLVLDGSQVELLGGLCLELLLSACAHWRRSGHDVTFENVSQNMINDLSHYGLSPEKLLELPA